MSFLILFGNREEDEGDQTPGGAQSVWLAEDGGAWVAEDGSYIPVEDADA